jgi:hypothetical protein
MTVVRFHYRRRGETEVLSFDSDQWAHVDFGDPLDLARQMIGEWAIDPHLIVCASTAAIRSSIAARGLAVVPAHAQAGLDVQPCPCGQTTIVRCGECAAVVALMEVHAGCRFFVRDFFGDTPTEVVGELSGPCEHLSDELERWRRDAAGGAA